MVGGVEMPGGVLVLRIVTAADVPTGETEAQVHPAISNFQTVLTSIGARRDFAYLVEVATVFCHMFQFSFLDTPGSSCLFSLGSQDILLINPFEQEKTYRSPLPSGLPRRRREEAFNGREERILVERLLGGQQPSLFDSIFSLLQRGT